MMRSSVPNPPASLVFKVSFFTAVPPWFQWRRARDRGAFLADERPKMPRLFRRTAPYVIGNAIGVFSSKVRSTRARSTGKKRMDLQPVRLRPTPQRDPIGGVENPGTSPGFASQVSRSGFGQEYRISLPMRSRNFLSTPERRTG